jgi:hypothetical protein
VISLVEVEKLNDRLLKVFAEDRLLCFAANFDLS